MLQSWRNIVRFCVHHVPAHSFCSQRIERYEGQQEEEKRRRMALDHVLPNKSVTVIPATKTQFISNDIPFPFRQSNNFFYLTGFEEPEAVLVVDKHTSDTKFVLFVQPKDKVQEMWHGKRVGTDGALEYGADEAFNLSTFVPYLNDVTSKSTSVILDKQKPQNMPSLPSGVVLQQLSHYIDPLRFVKSEKEIELAQKAADISEIGFRAIMRSSRPGISEHYLTSELEWECKRNGAQRLAYPPVVAGGERANTLHYITNDKIINDGEMVLVDGGAELHCFSSDVSRTWPVNGKFTQAQKDLYSAVLYAQRKCVNACREGTSINKIHSLSIELLSEKLRSLGILNSKCDDYYRFYPHCIGHYLGMDVHDTTSISYGEKLKRGSFVTIEPGLYIPKSPEIDPKYHGIGIRIEDNVIITGAEPINVTQNIPKEIDEIEEAIRSKNY